MNHSNLLRYYNDLPPPTNGAIIPAAVAKATASYPQSSPGVPRTGDPVRVSKVPAPGKDDGPGCWASTATHTHTPGDLQGLHLVGYYAAVAKASGESPDGT